MFLPSNAFRNICVPSAAQGLRQHIASGKTLATYPEAVAFDKSQILLTPCDVLIPAAIGGVITEANAAKLNCKLVIEAANGPTTPEGDKILRERGIIVLPGVQALLVD